MGGRIFYQLEQNYTIKQPNTHYSEETNINIETLHGGMIAFLALLAALLIPVAVMIFDKAFDKKFKIHSQNNTTANENSDISDLDDFFPWEKDALLKKVAKIHFLLLAFVLAAICLILMGINFEPIRITAIILYTISCIFILTRFFCLTKWLFAQSKITTQETYRQKVKFKYLRELRRDADLINVWTVTWNNISPTNPHQLSYLKIFLATAPKIPDEMFALPYMYTFFQTIKEDNPRINITKSDMQKTLLNYSLDSLSQKNDDRIDIRQDKYCIIETLLEIQLKKDPSTLGITFHETDDYISKSNDYSVLEEFMRLLLRSIDRQEVANDTVLKIFMQYLPRQWDITNLLDEKEQSKKDGKELICLKVFSDWLANTNSKHKRCITQALLKGVANPTIFSELLSFYKIYNNNNEEESVKYYARDLKDVSAYPTKLNGVSDDKNAVKILLQIIPSLKEAEHINSVEKALRKVGRGLKAEDEKERLENLKYYFKLAKNLQTD